MRRLAAVLACIATSAHADDTVFASGFERPWVSGYVVGYQRNLMPLDAIDFDAVTHLMVGRVTPNADGTVDTHFDIDNVNGPIWAQQASAAAHAGGAKAILMVGGAGEYAGWVGAASPQNRATFVANLVATAANLGYDGLDLDWEPLPSSDYANLSALVDALRTAAPNLALTMPVGWINANFDDVPEPFWGTIAGKLDQFNVMTYDMIWDRDGWQSWHESALTGESGTTPSSVATSVDFYRRSGVRRGKLGIGIPFYGACWRGVTGPRASGGTIVASDNAMSYRNIVEGYWQAGLRVWDAAAQVPYLSSAAPLGAQQCTFVTYDDAQSIAAKGAFVRANGLGGAIVWTVAQGYLPSLPAGQRDPLVQAIKSAF
ncbi:MAG TPA: glycoside hydrolase family 18 protein [Tahibacter sp.]|nr:glycoside hydrolase family 18 protein [Tahibacter sp.]